MYSYVFGCNDVALKVESNSQQLIKDLVEMFGEYYSDINVTPTTTIRYLENSVPDKYLFKDRESDTETYNYLNYDGNILDVCFGDKYSSSKLQFAQRIMCNVFIIEFQKAGYSIVHGACIAKDNNSFIISGNKGAGKTTTLLRLLEQGYDFISNDKVAVKNEDSKITTCGIPHSMGIIKEDIDSFNIDKKFGTINGPKIYFKVADIDKALNVDVYNKAYLNSIIFPKYEKGRTEISVSKCEDNLKSFGEQNIFKENAVAKQKSYLLDIMGPIDYQDCEYLNNVDGNVVRQGENTFDQLDTLLKSKINKNSECKKYYKSI